MQKSSGIRKTKVLIIGSGIGAFSAAIYAARCGHNPILLEGYSSDFWNDNDTTDYPGIIEPIKISELIKILRLQAEKVGTEIICGNIDTIDFPFRPFKVFSSCHIVFESSAIIIATGTKNFKPDTDIFKEVLDMDHEGYIITKSDSAKTNIRGIFAADIVKLSTPYHAILLAASGCMAALEADRFLSEQECRCNQIETISRRDKNE